DVGGPGGREENPQGAGASWDRPGRRAAGYFAPAFASLFRLRVAAAFFAEAERSAAVRDAEAAPPFLPPRLLETCVSALPRPLPDLLPPPDSLLTVAQARRSASPSGTPRPSYPSAMCSAFRFCLSVYFDLSPRGMAYPPGVPFRLQAHDLPSDRK